MGWGTGILIVMLDGKGRVVLNEGTGCKTGMGNDANGEQDFTGIWRASSGRWPILFGTGRGSIVHLDHGKHDSG